MISLGGAADFSMVVSRSRLCFVRASSVFALLDHDLAPRCFWPRGVSNCMCFASVL